MKPSTRTRSSGFTLIETLIVITIIVVLAAIMMPVAKGFRDRAKASVCTQNLRQIGVGLLSYISENNGRFPDGIADVSWFGGISTSRCWYDAAAENMGRPYVIYHKGDPLPAAFGCPAGHGKAYEPAWPYTGDYGYNTRLGRVTDGVMTLAAVKNPAATPFVQDIVKQNGFGEWIFNAGYDKKSGSAFAARHNGSGNILWVDGHVSSFKYAEYMDYANKPPHGGAYNFIRGNW
jgi:prepilin-type processing-associated H-X9-DG protein/prepilin-type N-terminal cleavage/methylation domain-containing protein